MKKARLLPQNVPTRLFASQDLRPWSGEFQVQVHFRIYRPLTKEHNNLEETSLTLNSHVCLLKRVDLVSISYTIISKQIVFIVSVYAEIVKITLFNMSPPLLFDVPGVPFPTPVAICLHIWN